MRQLRPLLALPLARPELGLLFLPDITTQFPARHQLQHENVRRASRRSQVSPTSANTATTAGLYEPSRVHDHRFQE